MEKMLKLDAEKRDIFGKKLKPFRKEGKIPAVLYGRKKKSTPLFVSTKEFKKIWKKAGESTIIDLTEENSKKPISVLIHDVAFDPVKDEPIHVDFYAVEMDKPIKANIPIVFKGVSPAIKELGGILVKVIHEIEIEALPKELPHEIEVDISKLKTFEDRIFVSDIKLSDSVKISAKKNEVLALAELPKEEPVEEEPISVEDIEVEKKGKEEKHEGDEIDEGDKKEEAKGDQEDKK